MAQEGPQKVFAAIQPILADPAKLSTGIPFDEIINGPPFWIIPLLSSTSTCAA
ncbi:hypothetical protein [Pseudomonas hygromyciniae]|uniref:hypothetical protein n=1 Tax=Pseudomonas hygromyciniae TaxID=2812000 RepID=UPI001F07F956|nr:hypothetical protein [Pseudomonas hygromyciniae]